MLQVRRKSHPPGQTKAVTQEKPAPKIWGGYLLRDYVRLFFAYMMRGGGLFLGLMGYVCGGLKSCGG